MVQSQLTIPTVALSGIIHRSWDQYCRFISCIVISSHMLTSKKTLSCNFVKMTPVGFEPTPFRNGALSHRLRPLGQSVSDGAVIQQLNVTFMGFVCILSAWLSDFTCATGCNNRGAHVDRRPADDEDCQIFLHFFVTDQSECSTLNRTCAQKCSSSNRCTLIKTPSLLTAIPRRMHRISSDLRS